MDAYLTRRSESESSQIPLRCPFPIIIIRGQLASALEVGLDDSAPLQH